MNDVAYLGATAAYPVDRALTRTSSRRPATTLEVSTSTVERATDLAETWRDLDVRGDGSFFTSWPWIGTWLDVLPPEIRPILVTVREGDAIVGLAIFVRHDQVRHRILGSHGLHLHQTGDTLLDGITIEYNGVLADRRRGPAVTASVLRFLMDHVGGWDELMLSGVAPEVGNQVADTHLWVRERDRKPFAFVDLDAIRVGGGDYLASLSANSRYQIRRSVRLYEKDGPIVVEAAEGADAALRMFDDLAALHQAYWTGRGRPGSFSNPFFVRFHRAMIARHVADGAVQLLKVSAGARVIGYLYNLVHRRRIHAYQSGFDYGDDGKLKPGLVCHHLAIEHNLRLGAGLYDLMAGEGQYKSSLSTGTGELVWLAAQRPRLKFRIEEALRSVKHRLAASSEKAT